MKFSLVIPVYRNRDSLDEVIEVCNRMNDVLQQQLELVFVVDGCPDGCFSLLQSKTSRMMFAAKIINQSRNFGAFSAVKCGFAHASGDYCAVMAADLQEPPELITELLQRLEKGEAEIIVGTRQSRNDPMLSQLFAQIYWYLYKKFIFHDLPNGGVDIFACTRKVRDYLLRLEESSSSLVGQLWWLGFSRAYVGYDRRERKHGKSTWSFHKKIRYLSDSIFTFTNAPINFIWFCGSLGLALSCGYPLILILSKLHQGVTVPGYAALVSVISFFSGLILLSLGIIGSYVWRIFENSKHRPQYLVQQLNDYSVKHLNAIDQPMQGASKTLELPN